MHFSARTWSDFWKEKYKTRNHLCERDWAKCSGTSFVANLLSYLGAAKSPLHSKGFFFQFFWVYLGVKTCEVFLCFAAIVRVRLCHYVTSLGVDSAQYHTFANLVVWKRFKLMLLKASMIAHPHGRTGTFERTARNKNVHNSHIKACILNDLYWGSI